MMRTLKAALILFFLILPCQSFAEDPAPEKLKVVTTFSVLRDMAFSIGSDRIDLYNIVGPNMDMHEYPLSPQDVARVKDADLLIVNGLSFEPWLARLIQSSEFKGKLVVAAHKANTIALDKEAAMEQKQHLQDHPEENVNIKIDANNATRQGIDPHAWHNLSNARIYLGNIATALSRADPANEKFYSGNEQNIRKQLLDLERWAATKIREVPESKRKMVTTHDALSYLATTYRIEYITPMGFNSSIAPSAKDIAGVIETIKAKNIRAMFLENMTDPRILDQISKETGVPNGGTLYTDSLGAARAGGDTYFAMFRHNVETIVAAMQANY